MTLIIPPSRDAPKKSKIVKKISKNVLAQIVFHTKHSFSKFCAIEFSQIDKCKIERMKIFEKHKTVLSKKYESDLFKNRIE